tara:strand:+ start:699 stop:1376 length:678 start_codon:yes stop_codon:yes gene_type:complete
MSQGDNMVITPRFITSRDAGPRKRATEAREIERAKRKKSSLLRKVRRARLAKNVTGRNVQPVRTMQNVASKTAKIGSRFMGLAGVALLVMDGVNSVGSVGRRAELGVSGRLLEAMDQDAIYGNMDEMVTGVSQARSRIESNEALLRIIGLEGRVNSQIAELGAYFREKETAIATGSDIIEREPDFDHLGTIADKVIEKASVGIKEVADEAINSIRGWLGKGELVR